jgi:hypothetical protein
MNETRWSVIRQYYLTPWIVYGIQNPCIVGGLNVRQSLPALGKAFPKAISMSQGLMVGKGFKSTYGSLAASSDQDHI